MERNKKLVRKKKLLKYQRKCRKSKKRSNKKILEDVGFVIKKLEFEVLSVNVNTLFVRNIDCLKTMNAIMILKKKPKEN